MIILDRNSYDLLSYLIKLEEPETVMSISKVLNQSRRKVYYHLDKINEALPSEIPKIISYPRIGILLSSQQKAACRTLLADLDDYSYVMSIQERMLLSITYIAIAKDRVTIEKLMQINAVSRNTILNDLNELRQRLSFEPYSIKLQATKSKGYYLDCHPLSKIQYLNKLLHTIYTDSNPNFIAMMRDKLRDFADLSSYFSDDISSFIRGELQVSQALLGKKINSQDIRFMVATLPYQLLSYQNLGLSEREQRDLLSEFSPIKERKEYEIARHLNENLKREFHIELDEIETSLIAVLLLSYRKDRDMHLESHDYDDMRRVLSYFIDAFELDYHVCFKHKQLLLNQLLTHCKALLFRKAYGIVSNNPLTDQIKDKYADLFAMTKVCLSILENAWSIKMNDDDIAYITIHIGGELVHSETKPTPPAVLTLVCDEGIGVQKLFMQQCKQYLPHSKIEAVLTSEQFYSVADIMAVDLVISTNDSLDTQLPTLFVHSILRDDDAIKLIRFAKQRGQTGQDDFDKKLETYIRHYVKNDSDCYVLKTKIEGLINEELLYDNKR
ncbi:BglG family transcription antiterminator [Streptococcus mutans]|jgi:Transcriptional antiterminator|uniref:BglG family transcription antiterminator n=1 Tax=Streptococcus mutans TaxID=1309 RepID=UPI0002B4DFD6|nr:transcription antiterminator [Streptococcus mutans]RKV82501.1 MAG: transcription antiterminator [Streptococcus sp.]EMC07541.1 transcriptional antiterminator [Streptococcus mutans NLML9]EMC09677.1 transcriptional antiterminator [Streptococcus mutans M2A]EMC38958.1 transcriptional antiterminator [Streptococcus mutans 66-2A]EMC56848.1 transcriptional antiterminator [Streptococcus mutans M230]